MSAEAIATQQTLIEGRLPNQLKRRHVGEILLEAHEYVNYDGNQYLIKKKQRTLGHQIPVIVTLPTISAYQTTIFSTAPVQDLDFELKFNANYHIHDNKSVILQIALQETANSPVVLNPFEAGFDKQEAVQWLCNGEVKHRTPLLGCIIGPMAMMTQTEYNRYCQSVGHNTRMQMTTSVGSGNTTETGKPSLDTLRQTGGTAEIQTITTVNTLASGFFKLGFRGQVTAPIAWNATAAQIQAALESLSSFSSFQHKNVVDATTDTAFTATNNIYYSGLKVTVSASFTAAGAKTFTFGPVGPVGDLISFLGGTAQSSGGTIEPEQIAVLTTAGGYATTNYYMIVPTPFDEEGFYLGAIGKNEKWTVRFRVSYLSLYWYSNPLF